MSDDPNVFDRKRASNYDTRILYGIPGYESLHETVLDVLKDALPAQARILVAGAGTGKEVLNLGQASPGWRFTAVDPSGPMLDTLKSRLREAGLEDRAAVHNVFVRDLPPAEKGFDAATSLLVSHFIPDPAERTAYFRSIADRLTPGAPLVFADVHGDREARPYQLLFSAWKNRCRRSAMPREDMEGFFLRMERDVAIIPEPRLMELVRSAGFETPAPFWRGLMFGAWVTAKKGN